MGHHHGTDMSTSGLKYRTLVVVGMKTGGYDEVQQIRKVNE